MAIHEVPTFGEPRMGRRFSSQPGGNTHSAIYAFNNIADCLFAKCFLFYCLFRIVTKNQGVCRPLSLEEGFGHR